MQKDDLLLWTLQYKNDWEELQASGILRRSCNFNPFCDDDDRATFEEPYKWMVEQMRLRMPHSSCVYPIWAWYQPKPDLRLYSWHTPAGTKMVRVAFRAPAHKVLLLDFDAWHCVINRWYLALRDEEKEVQARMRETWQRIFDLRALRESPLWGSRPHYTQAVVDEISLDQVVDVTHYRGRGISS